MDMNRKTRKDFDKTLMKCIKHFLQEGKTKKRKYGHEQNKNIPEDENKELGFLLLYTKFFCFMN